VCVEVAGCEKVLDPLYRGFGMNGGCACCELGSTGRTTFPAEFTNKNGFGYPTAGVGIQ
jgi:hypothetical protein